MSEYECGLKMNSVYDMTFPSGDTARVKLVEVQTDSVIGAPDDYIFRCFDPEFGLMKESSIEGAFPIPDFLLKQCIFEEITDSDELAQIPDEKWEFKWSAIGVREGKRLMKILKKDSDLPTLGGEDSEPEHELEPEVTIESVEAKIKAAIARLKSEEPITNGESQAIMAEIDADIAALKRIQNA